MNKWLIGLAVAAVSLTAPVHSADMEAGKTTASTICVACHMADGNSVNPIWPKLAGQHESYIVKQLSEFKAGVRKDPTMMGMAAALSDQDMANVAAYYTAQKVNVGEAAADKVAKGELIYRGGVAEKGIPACTACHGPTGAGVSTSGFPAVGGQHAAYIEKQLNDFASDTRNNDANRMMRDIAHKMNAEEMAAVAQYMQGLH